MLNTVQYWMEAKTTVLNPGKKFSVCKAVVCLNFKFFSFECQLKRDACRSGDSFAFRTLF